MLPIITFCGASGSGKTTLVCQVIRELISRGLKVGAIKHHGHAGPVARGDEGKDSELLRGSGANPVVLSHGEGLDVWIAAGDEPWGANAIGSAYMKGLDLVIAEGYKSANLKKIEVVGAGREPLLPEGGKLLGVVGVGGAGRAAAQQRGLPFFDADDIAGVTGLVVDSYREPTPSPSKVSIKIDGRDLDINPFVQMVLANTIRGMLGGLKGGSASGAVEVRID